MTLEGDVHCNEHGNENLLGENSIESRSSAVMDMIKLVGEVSLIEDDEDHFLLSDRLNLGRSSLLTFMLNHTIISPLQFNDVIKVGLVCGCRRRVY